MAEIEQMKAAVAAYVQRHTAGDVDGVVALFADNATVWDPVDSEPHVGGDAVRGFFAGTHDMVDSLTLTPTGPVRCAGDYAAFPMMALSVMGDFRLEIDIIDVMTFDSDGLITEMKAYWNMADARAL